LASVEEQTFAFSPFICLFKLVGL